MSKTDRGKSLKTAVFALAFLAALPGAASAGQADVAAQFRALAAAVPAVPVGGRAGGTESHDALAQRQAGDSVAFMLLFGLGTLPALLALTLFVAVLGYRALGTLQDTLLFQATARTTLQTPLWIPQSLWLAGLVFFLVCLVFMSTYVALLLVRRRYDEVSAIAGIPHVGAAGRSSGTDE